MKSALIRANLFISKVINEIIRYVWQLNYDKLPNTCIQVMINPTSVLLCDRAARPLKL